KSLRNLVTHAATATRPNVQRMEQATLADVEAMRLLLRGGSVIDWHRLAFADDAEVDRFLSLNEFDPANADDMDRLEELRADAVEYLTRNFSYRIPEDVAHGMSARDLLLLASSRGKKQTYACIVLKVMHVMHHLAGRELLFKLPVSDDEVFGFVEAKVVKVVEEIRAAGYPIVEFAWSRKERDSVVTKLLAKKATIAADVFDKLRFRLITRSLEDLPPVLHEVLHRLIPFNYVIPGQTVNAILPFRRFLDIAPPYERFSDQLQSDLDTEENGNAAGQNEFSGPTYKVINFVADLPVRIDQFLCRVPGAENDLGAVIFVLTEFQVMDAETAKANEAGENSHAKYKARQHERVKARLSEGERGLQNLQAAPAAPPDSDGEADD
ncbi:MAG TPA: TIGR04552 family protein, partial [Polyangia bacterium]